MAQNYKSTKESFDENLEEMVYSDLTLFYLFSAVVNVGLGLILLLIVECRVKKLVIDPIRKLTNSIKQPNWYNQDSQKTYLTPSKDTANRQKMKDKKQKNNKKKNK